MRLPSGLGNPIELRFSELYDQMFTLFDFEPKYFKKFGLETDFVGHQIFFDKKVIKKKKNTYLFSQVQGQLRLKII